MTGMLVLSLAVAPLAGGICTMACGDGAVTCCCRTVGASEAETLSQASCCVPEFSSADGDPLKGERVVSNGRVVLSSFVLPIAGDVSCLRETSPNSSLSVDREGGSARSSPLFLLNAVFII